MQKYVLARHRPHSTLEGHAPQPPVSLPSGYTCHVLLVAQALLTVPLAVYKSVVEKVDVGPWYCPHRMVNPASGLGGTCRACHLHPCCKARLGEGAAELAPPMKALQASGQISHHVTSTASLLEKENQYHDNKKSTLRCNLMQLEQRSEISLFLQKPHSCSTDDVPGSVLGRFGEGSHTAWALGRRPEQPIGVSTHSTSEMTHPTPGQWKSWPHLTG